VPTLRSEFSFEQFETVMQKLAHEIALDNLKELKGDLRIVAHGSRLSEVATDGISIRFYTHHLSYSRQGKDYSKWFGFDIEDKEYTTSSHRSKISLWASDEKSAEKQVTEFISQIMADVTPTPRFSLSALKKLR